MPPALLLSSAMGMCIRVCLSITGSHPVSCPLQHLSVFLRAHSFFEIGKRCYASGKQLILDKISIKQS